MKKFLALPIDWVTLFVPILVTITGIITIYTITFAEHGSSLAISQLVFALVGLVVMAGFMFSDYRFWGSYAGLLLLLGFLTLLPLLPFWASKLPFTIGVLGAHRWLGFKSFQVQPAEIFKLIAIIFGAKFLSNKIGKLGGRSALLYVAITLVSFAMIVLEPDLGTASVVLVIFSAMLLATRPKLRYIAPVVIVILLALPLIWSKLQPYQKSRVTTFLNTSSIAQCDPSIESSKKENYNVCQSLIAVGSGGMYGKGFGQGSQTVLNFLPVAHADFIFAGFAEATGFVGSFVLVVLYVILVYRAISIASASTDPFGQLLAIGIAAKFAFQAIVHIAMNIGLLPVTGIPLPFMSYGGTALIIDLACIGLLQSIYIRHKKTFFA